MKSYLKDYSCWIVFLTSVFIFLYVQYCFAEPGVILDTAFDCEYWEQGRRLECDKLAPYGDWTCSGIKSKISQEANRPGSTGKGFIFYVGDGVNRQSGCLARTWTGYENELWVRWYMRYPPGFKWSEINFDKWMYFKGDKMGAIPELHWGSSIISTGFNNYGQGNKKGWRWINRKGKGLWHCYEAHIKMDTEGRSKIAKLLKRRNGIAQLWIDNEMVVNVHNAYYGTGTGWNHLHFLSNQAIPGNGSCVPIYVDDIKLVDENYTQFIDDGRGNRRIGCMADISP